MPDQRYRGSAQLPYQTQLSPAEEQEFQKYMELKYGMARGGQQANWPDSDYDERGEWKAQKQGVDQQGNWTAGTSSLPQSLTGKQQRSSLGSLQEEKADGPHDPDTWKTPYSHNMSNESKYSISGRDPAWDASGKLITPTGAVVVDESANEQKTSQNRVLNSSAKLANLSRYRGQ